jgi:hypothetical protein
VVFLRSRGVGAELDSTVVTNPPIS